MPGKLSSLPQQTDNFETHITVDFETQETVLDGN
jgi:hypothetical protein